MFHVEHRVVRTGVRAASNRQPSLTATTRGQTEISRSGEHVQRGSLTSAQAVPGPLAS